MTRPCTCDRCHKLPWGKYTPDQCRLCWLYHHDADYHDAWDHTERFKKKPCLHLGPILTTQECQLCYQKKMVDVHACTLHGQCSREVLLPAPTPCCLLCQDYQAE